MATLSDTLAAYRICAQAEGKSPKTVQWIMSSVPYFSEYLGTIQDFDTITANDLRGFIIALKQRPKFINHPYNKPMQQRISAQSIQTYARAASPSQSCNNTRCYILLPPHTSYPQ